MADPRGNSPKRRLGGVIHTYQRYDPTRFPPPTQPPGDGAADAAMRHMLMHGSMRRFTDEELRDAIRIDPSQIAGLGPSLEALIAMLEERKRKILEKYDPDPAVDDASDAFAEEAQGVTPPDALAAAFQRAVRDRQLHDLEKLWYRAERRDKAFASRALRVMESLGTLYELEELVSKYDFTGREAIGVDAALRIKQELETIDKLLEQLREAMENAQVAVIDLDELRQFVDEADVEQLREFGRQVQEELERQAEEQGLVRDRGGYTLTPRAMRVFQSKLLDEIFSELQASRSGRHSGPVQGDGVVETPRTRPYAFGDSPAHMDISNTIVNAALRESSRPDRAAVPNGPLRALPEDIDVHETRNTPRCASYVLMDMSGSMRHGGQYIQCKTMALALDGLIRSEYPGDFLRFIEIFSLAKQVEPGRIVELTPKPVTIREPWVRLRVDLADPDIPEAMIPPHFTNIQRGLAMARRFLAAQDTPNRQVMLITDGLPTAHMETGDNGEQFLYLLYPPDPLTERATMREALACKRENITINVFLLPSWWQSEEDVAFAHALAEQTEGRVFFTGGDDLDRFVLWDYVQRRRRVIG